MSIGWVLHNETAAVSIKRLPYFTVVFLLGIHECQYRCLYIALYICQSHFSDYNIHKLKLSSMFLCVSVFVHCIFAL